MKLDKQMKLNQKLDKVWEAMGYEMENTELELPLDVVILAGAEYIKMKTNEALLEDNAKRRIKNIRIKVTDAQEGAGMAPIINLTIPAQDPPIVHVHVPEPKKKETTVVRNTRGDITRMVTE